MGVERDLVAGIDAAAAREGFVLDAGQQELRDRLAALGGGRRRQGLYIHGPAGRGKSWLADAFYDALPTARKARVHFHGFFDELHRSIQNHRSQTNAMDRALDEITGGARLLFFDELHVHDSGDARLLTRLLEHVFARDLTVLATSNYAPDDLLPNPIWHPVFEPGIALIKANMSIHRLGGAVDYRAARQDHSHGFAAGQWSMIPAADRPLSGEGAMLTVRGREFPVLADREGELWASFDQLCGSPLSTIEYLEWARLFPRWVITDVPSFAEADAESDAEAQQRFINLIDVLVDADICTTFISPHDRAAFIAAASQRPDAFRMISRLQLLSEA